MTLPPKTGPVIMLVLGQKQIGGKNAAQNLHPGKDYPKTQRS